VVEGDNPVFFVSKVIVHAAGAYGLPAVVTVKREIDVVLQAFLELSIFGESLTIGYVFLYAFVKLFVNLLDPVNSLFRRRN
jgi:hypothetical protein